MRTTDAISLQEKIIGNKDSVRQIIESLGFRNIKERGNYFQFPRLDGDNQSANVVYIDTLKWNCYTRAESGNLYSLVMNTKGYNFPKAVKYCAKELGIKEADITKVKYPFSGFYRGLEKDNNDDSSIRVYSEDILKQYNGLSQKFFLDGVAFTVQEKYNIGFSHEENAIAIPIRDMVGHLIGVKMRNNDSNCPHDKRFWSAYSYPKTRVTYGLYNNYSNIVRKNSLVIFESEKAVMQAASCGCNLAIGLGGHDISKSQSRIIKSLMVDKIVIAFDEGLDEYEITDQCEKLKSFTEFYKPRIYYIYDKHNDVLKEGSKDSPIDHGKAVFQDLVRGHLKEFK